MMQKRCQQADRESKSELLDEMEAVTGHHRKSPIRLMNESIERQARQ